jgi:hypothetical protein
MIVAKKWATRQHLGNIRLPDSKQLGRLHLFETASFQDAVNLEYQSARGHALSRWNSKL